MLDIRDAMNQAAELFRVELGSNLAGIYVHGSVAMGCFNPEKSDLDLLVVVYKKLSRDVQDNF
ncbi:nucleotidyltransferase domain-containing protein [Paenibacillus pinihumi]|uniref:nucleotidyltransferase domain-containing protein n=1 Tax=Paenibacillus pinihumi TaxID=669462 RepID=UPI00040618D2|nr:nucleotidyltransferase domain-containing protein [Paenibacillus pinihumi]